ncbi:DUF2316 family protein [Actinoplanes sp. CA-054009]
MSLDREQQDRTRAELRANFELAGIEPGQVRADLGFTAERLDETLGLTPASDPADVWLLRDYLESRILAGGGVPRPFTVLTGEARAAAARWFPLRTPPPVA